MPPSSADSLYEVGSEDEVIEGTQLESVEDLRAAFSEAPLPTFKEPRATDDTLAFRPVRRPPMALLSILYDGRPDGEVLRLTADVTVIGRGEGDVVIPHDAMMSGKHAEISRRFSKGRYRWVLNDLNSRNGTYVRITDTRMAHGQMLIIGDHRLRFDAAPQGAGSSAALTPPAATSGWDRTALSSLIPSLVEQTAKGDGQRWFLKAGDNWLGRDPNQCDVVLTEDLMVSPRHARIYRDAKNRWTIENARSRNGVWLRVQRIPIEGTAHILLGEQRFIFRVL